jgi:hypothetical protein
VKSLAPSIVRTVVPLIVGYLLSLPIIPALGITGDQLTNAVTLALAGAYYVVGRVIEVYVMPRTGAVMIGLGVGGPTYQPTHRR